MYYVRGFVLHFRDTDFLKSVNTVDEKIAPNVNNEDLPKALQHQTLKIEKEEPTALFSLTHRRETLLTQELLLSKIVIS